MKINLTKKPKNPIVIEGFPGFGLIGTITTEFLIDHLKAEKIGEFEYDELPATLAIHQGKLVNPMSVFYSKKYNIVILHTILNTVGYEWKACQAILDMCNELKVKEIISIEGVAGSAETNGKCYFFSEKQETYKELELIGLTPLKESIILGVTGAILLKSKIPVTCLFAQTMSQFPDSKGAAEIIEALDKYLSLSIDTKPLIKQAENFEKKLKSINEQAAIASKEADQKRPNYFG